MLGIQIGTETLDIRPGTVLEIDRNNGYLQFDPTIVGDFSLPFEIDATPKNNRLMAYAGLPQSRVNTIGVDAYLLDNGIQYSGGKIKVEKPTINLNRSSNGSLSLYYLSGISSFYQDIKDVKMQDIDLGGDRVFRWSDTNDTSVFDPDNNGFWGHIHKVVDAPIGAYDYAFYPVINKDFGSVVGDSALLNHMVYDTNAQRVLFSRATTGLNDCNIIVPFPYLSYVLQKALAYVGWRIEGDILQDPDFQKITLVNFTGINWGWYLGSPFPIYGWPQVTFNLKNHVPNMTLSAFMIALKNRFGWWLDFDRITKTIRIKSLQQVAVGSRKDMTKYVDPSLVKPIATQTKIYGLKNDFTGVDSYSGDQPTLNGTNYKGTVINKTDLPAPTPDLMGQIYLVTSENNYYICSGLYASQQQMVWQLFSYNVYDVLPDGYTDSIETSCITLGMEAYSDPLNYSDFLPRIDQQGGIEGMGNEQSLDNIILLFYNGKRNTKGGQPYPYACSHIYDSTGAQVTDWSLSWKCTKNDGSQVGLYDLYWKKLLDTIQVSETFQFTLYLPRIEYLKLQFSDIINIANVNMYITKIKERVPYDGSVDVEAVRS